MTFPAHICVICYVVADYGWGKETKVDKILRKLRLTFNPYDSPEYQNICKTSLAPNEDVCHLCMHRESPPEIRNVIFEKN